MIMEKDYNSEVERLLEAPHWVIDMLPQQVPPDSPGQFFAVEKYYLSDYCNMPPQVPLRRQFGDVLLKLNCYHDFVVNYAPDDKWVKNPEPAQLYSWLTKSLGHAHLCVLVDDEDALITASSGDCCLTLYNPTEGLLKLVGQLATAAGLFLWRPPCETSDNS